MEIQISKNLNLSEEETKGLSEKLSSQLVDTAEGEKAAVLALKTVEQSKVESVKVQSQTKAIVS